MNTVVALLGDWLLSWMVHTTIACTVALIAGRWLVADPRERDLLWKTVLVLPLGTSLLSVTPPYVASGHVDLSAVARPHMPTALASVRVSVAAPDRGRPPQVHVRDATARALRYTILGLILMPAIVATTRMGRARRNFRTSLRERRTLDARELGIPLTALWLGRRPIRISVSPRVASAAAVARDEICVSPRLAALDRIEHRGVLMHEIAHLRRNDTAWVAVAETVACVLAAQPLVRLVVQRFRRDAEFVCDDIAIAETGDARTYVRALTTFAAVHDTAAVPAPTYGSSLVVQRALRVLRSRTRDSQRSWNLACPLTLIALLGVLVLLPRVRVAALNPAVETRRIAWPVPGVPRAERITVTVDVR